MGKLNALELAKANFKRYGITIPKETENFLIVTQGKFLSNDMQNGTFLH